MGPSHKLIRLNSHSYIFRLGSLSVDEQLMLEAEKEEKSETEAL